MPTNKHMVTGGNCIGSRVPEKMMHSKSGELHSDQMFPMVTVPLDTLLKMTEMHTHEKLMETWRWGFVFLQLQNTRESHRNKAKILERQSGR